MKIKVIGQSLRLQLGLGLRYKLSVESFCAKVVGATSSEAFF